MHEGRVVVDAVAGVADAGTAKPVDSGTLFFAASTGKGVASSVTHVLVERGDLSYDQPVADVWPEFGAHGKDGVTLRDVLMHTAGVPGLWPDITPEDLGDWDRVCAFIAAQRPWWPSGTRIGYHALTFGFMLGELVRRATGRTFADALRDEIAAPLGVTDELHFGVPPHLLSRVARQGPDSAAPPPPEPGSPLDRAIPRGVQPTAAFANRHDVLRADVPSQGTMSARAVARMYAALLGHIDDIKLISPERLATMATPAFSGADQVVGIPTTIALGYSPARPGGVESRPGSTFGWVGSNGSAAYADIDAGVAVAVMRNRIIGDMSAVGAIDRMIADSLG
ncbi:MAG: beta-lactamase family protein [Actinomycetota bacterium]|nr:beta-lactamase family protein [Actinomycetota bacterium]